MTRVPRRCRLSFLPPPPFDRPLLPMKIRPPSPEPPVANDPVVPIAFIWPTSSEPKTRRAYFLLFNVHFLQLFEASLTSIKLWSPCAL